MRTNHTSNKRKLHEIDDITFPSTKRTKLSTPAQALMQSSLFHSDLDQQQFQKKFASIETSELVQKLSIPRVINQEIAEFATGTWRICGNSDCENEISVLFGDQQTIKKHGFEEEHDDGNKYIIYNKKHSVNKIGYNFCGDTNKYFCNQCIDMTVTSECSACCSSRIYLLSSPRCKVCKKFTDCPCGKMGQIRCENDNCSNGSIWCEHCFTCDVCRIDVGPDEYICNECGYEN